ncbi:MAG: DEAD/DEAH box helicase [Pseudotabrizicola sp.]|uniref:DEAD/DEAH box helicase n=1 Tax=Pseudotabrizicola sp. TaxID=2939647 RepID=UPI0027228240|nr:DEAD/DEAH box helicase [Pseudotabrizicola sp.]MDO8883591.1 DEAD/DEAH box helicase [Pseudotabrizicola sp.]MDP2081244.1 DEAD/DEAH box helicase [Pseudotabrizicola sp.]MDZ7576137.1 DEAD/DEAH box helicase [Pseudotabrizicola sp.]
MIDMNVAAPLAQALEAKGYEALTAVQMAVLADGVEGRDLLVSAQTGSGKTVAFGLAIAPEILAGSDRLLYADKPIALVVAPTRELALQVKRELDWLYGVAGAQIASCVGGMDYRTEKRVLDRGTHIVVGTPGRLRDHIERGSLDLSFCRATVLDEADEMLDLGFAEDLEFILGAAPQDRRTLMFSATVPKEIETLARTFQRDAMRIIAKGETKQHADIEYRAMSVASRDREHAIFNALRYYDAPTAIVFCKTRMNVTHLMARMTNRGFQAVALSGELSQQERTHALQSLRDGRARVCIATDVAARGIDLPGLELVIHADLPSNSDTLLHRSGRTGRAGSKGVSALIVPPAEAKKAQRLLAGAKVVAQWVKAPSAEEVQARDDQRILEHPALTEAVGDDAAMVGTLIERFGAEQTAAAFIRLWREGRSAPEVLSDSLPPPPASAPRERSEFGPSVWFTLTVGHSGRAEARWILPKICDGAGISKDGIGAIRVKEDITYVQIAEPLAGRFGPQLELEPGLIMERMEGEPSLERPERAPREDRPAYKPKPPRVVEDDAIISAPAPARKPYVKRDDAERKPYAPRAAAERAPYAKRDDADRKPYAPREGAERKPYAPRDGADRKPYAKREDGDRKPYAPREGAERKPYAKRDDAPAGGAKFKSAGFKSFGGSADKPARAAGFKSHASEGTGYKPKAEGDRAEKRTYAPKGDDARPYAKRDGKPAGKAGFKPAGADGKKPFARKSDAPARPRADAKDTSKRFVPPKGAKR